MSILQRRLLVAAAFGIAIAAAIMALWSRRTAAQRALLVAAPAQAAGQAPRGPVTVSIYDDGAPLSDRWVVFHDASGAVIAEAKSNEEGKASADVPRDAMVTIAYGNSIYQLVTVTGVQIGDAIVVGELEDEGEAARVVGTARIKLPGPHKEAARYTLSLGVGATEVAKWSEPLPVPVAKRFLDDRRKFRVLGEAFDARGEPLAYALDWASVRKGDVRLPPWSTDFRELTLVVSGLSPGMSSVDADLSIVAHENDRFERPHRSMPLAENAALRFLLPRGLAGNVNYRLEVSYGTSPDKSVFSRNAVSMADTTPIPLQEILLPRVSSATVTYAESRARPSVRYQVEGDASHADAAIVRLAWPETREHIWTILTPPVGSTSVRVPELPTHLKDWQPSNATTSVAVAVMEASFFSGFDEVRHKGIGELSEDPKSDEPRSYRYSATGDLSF